MMQLPRALRLVGYALLLLVLCATVRDTAHYDAQMIRWGVAYVAFAIAFLVGARAPEANRTRRLAALAVLTPAMLAMAAILPCQFGALSLVIVASQAALVLSPRQVAGWIAAQTLVLGWLVSDAFQLEDTIAQMVALLGFQSFAAVAVYLVRREALARRSLAHANAELRATRALLEAASREQERTRIARELHDVLGHDLTALSLQLEVASHLPHAHAASHLEVAREVSGRLLRNVREVVTAIRVTDGAGLRLALGTLIDGIASLTIHLDIPDELRVDDAARAHCVLRCVQEIITNALRHARARNLWIAITQEGGVITVDAHDDGRGAEVVEAGCGLSGMRDRIEELGGALRVAPAPSFAVRAMLPLEVRP
jgi:signal transduction histidine kinase